MKLIEWRKSKGWSQKTMAEKAMVSRQTYNKWERARVTPQPRMRMRLRAITSMDWWELSR